MAALFYLRKRKLLSEGFLRGAVDRGDQTVREASSMVKWVA
ncbi:MAG TPA: hypothetical protein VL978_16395 [Puia sp.]|nr:hypothetical protein [Puia sp.]